jgi:phosphonoacetate hydrolase
VAERACIMVWDGLRPDRVSPEVTPNLWRLAQEGVWFERSHAVYPTLTRANSPAISTGCRPGRAGVPGNSFCLPSSGSSNIYSSGDAANLQRLADADGRPIVLVDTLADRVRRAGGRTVVVGSGSPGSAFLQHPRAAEAGDLILCEGLPGMAEAMGAMHARFGAPPARALPDTEWNAYFTRIVTEHVLPELSPTLLIFWHTDPDRASHHCGHTAPETIQALRDADANLGAILEAYARLGLRDTTDVIITSDHGSSSITRCVEPAKDIAALLSNGVTVENGGSAFVYSPDPAAVVAAIRQLDYVGPVFTRTGSDQTMPLALVGLDGPRAPDVVFSLAWSDGEVGGVAGSAVGTLSKLRVDHGTTSPYDLRNTLVAQGPDFRMGWRNPVPVGNIDIAPTLTQLLRLDAGSQFEGRVLVEALRDGAPEVPAWQSNEEAISFGARGEHWVQRVRFEQVGATAYVAGGVVEPA